MPYITEQERHEFLGLKDVNTRKELAKAMAANALNGGQLNYMLSKTISEWLEINGLGYENCQAIMGMLEILKAEFIAQVILPYEELKALDNTNGIYTWAYEEINNKLDHHYGMLYSPSDTE